MNPLIKSMVVILIIVLVIGLIIGIGIYIKQHNKAHNTDVNTISNTTVQNVKTVNKIKEKFSPMRDLYFEYLKQKDVLREMIMEGSRRAREIACEKLENVHRNIGFLGRPFL